MMPSVTFTLLAAAFLLLVGCNSTSPSENKKESPVREPQTFYGKSVDKAHDVSEELSARDKEIARQSELLEGD